MRVVGGWLKGSPSLISDGSSMHWTLDKSLLSTSSSMSWLSRMILLISMLSNSWWALKYSYFLHGNGALSAFTTADLAGCQYVKLQTQHFGNASSVRFESNGDVLLKIVKRDGFMKRLFEVMSVQGFYNFLLEVYESPSNLFARTHRSSYSINKKFKRFLE